MERPAWETSDEESYQGFPMPADVGDSLCLCIGQRLCLLLDVLNKKPQGPVKSVACQMSVSSFTCLSCA